MRLLAETLSPNGGLDFVDDFGTSPLQSAAYTGNTALVKLLLGTGADANYRQDHPHRYTALMFAALSGKQGLWPLGLGHMTLTVVGSIKEQGRKSEGLLLVFLLVVSMLTGVAIVKFG